MFTEVTFKNLRCFRNFTLKNLTPLTLISGRNNSGKTTILEGIFLLMAYRKADVFFNLNTIRGIEISTPVPHIPMSIDPENIWETLFSDMDTEKKLCISMCDSENNVRILTLTKDDTPLVAGFFDPLPGQPIPQLSPTYSLKFSCGYGENAASLIETGRFLLNQGRMTQLFDKQSVLPNLPPTTYFDERKIPQNSVAEWIGKIEQAGKKEQLIVALRLLYETVDDIFIVPKNGVNTLFTRLQDKKTLPLRVMGDGINKLLHYISIMYANPGGVFLLDEIETGFHYSFYPKLWELLAKVAMETESQIFATTHSLECIHGAAEGAGHIAPDLLTYIRLEKENEAIIPYYFAKDDLAYVVKNEMEIR